MKNTFLASLAVFVTLSQIVTAPFARDIDWKDVSKEHNAWVEKCLKDFESIKIGMTRKEIDKVFPLAGGIQSASPGRYIHPTCPYFHIDIEFDFKRDKANQGRAITSDDDQVISVSKPYIERNGWD